MPSSRWMASTITPALRSPFASSSRTRRRTGSPRTSKARTETTPLLATVIKHRGAACTIPGGCLVRAGGHRSPAPFVAASKHEVLAFLRCQPGRAFIRARRGARRQMPAKSQDREIPADACRTRTILTPKVIRHVRDVFQPQQRAAIRQFRQRDVNPTYLPAKLPGDRQTAGRFAANDLAPGVALQLVSSSQAEIAGNRQEPFRDAPGVGDGIPYVLDGGIVRASCHYDAGGAAMVIARVNLTRYRSNVAQDIHPDRLPGKLPQKQCITLHLYKSILIKPPQAQAYHRP